MSCCHYLVSGHVQGVGFRRFTERRARELNLVGWVRNLNDGRVEILAQGEDQNLQLFERDIGRGPTGSRVENVARAPVATPLKSIFFEAISNGAVPWSEGNS